MLTARLVRWLLRGLARPDTLQVGVFRSGVVTISNVEIRRPLLVALLAAAGVTPRHGTIDTIEIALPWADPLPSGDRIHVNGVRLVLGPAERPRQREEVASGDQDARDEPEDARFQHVGDMPALAAIERLRRVEGTPSGKHALVVLFARLLGRMQLSITDVRVVVLPVLAPALPSQLPPREAREQPPTVHGVHSVGPAGAALELRLDEIRYSQPEAETADAGEAVLGDAGSRGQGVSRRVIRLNAASLAMIPMGEPLVAGEAARGGRHEQLDVGRVLGLPGASAPRQLRPDGACSDR